MTDRPVDGRGTAPAAGLPDGIPDDGTVPVPEIAFDALAGSRDWPDGTARYWGLPADTVLHEAGADPEHVRILRLPAIAPPPGFRADDRLVVDISRRAPAAGATFVVRDADGLDIRRIDAPDGNRACAAGETVILGRCCGRSAGSGGGDKRRGGNPPGIQAVRDRRRRRPMFRCASNTPSQARRFRMTDEVRKSVTPCDRGAVHTARQNVSPGANCAGV